MSKIELPFAVVFLCVSTLACTNPGKVTGGGTVHGFSEDLATFAFTGDSCSGDLNDPQGRFNFVERGGEVKMNGELTGLGLCVTEDQWEGEWGAEDCMLCEELLGTPSFLVYFNYRSTNPRAPGNGDGFACLIDNGEGWAADDDELYLYVNTGPFAGYELQGAVQGNVQQHTCD